MSLKMKETVDTFFFCIKVHLAGKGMFINVFSGDKCLFKT